MAKATRILVLLLLISLSACSGKSATGSGPTLVPTVLSQASRGIVAASGEIVPASYAELAFVINGRISAVEVAEGDQVSASDVLVRLDDEQLKAAVQQAEAAVVAAKAELAVAEEGPRAEELAAAQAGVASAEAQLQVAQAQVQGAAETVKQAEAQVALAKATLADIRAGATSQELAIARIAVDQAKNQLWGAQGNRDAIKGSPAASGGAKAQAEAAVAVAAEGVKVAELQLQRLEAGPRSGAVAQAREQVNIAEVGKSQAEAQAKVLEQQAQTAQAGVNEARARAAVATLGATEGQLARARAAVAQAEAALVAANVAIKNAALQAPFAGVVTRLAAKAGEAALPGQTVVTMADLGHLQVETTDLAERDVARVAVGQPVSIQVDAMPDPLTGRVSRIASQSSTIGGDVVYTVVIQLDEQPAELRWGMSVDVVIDASGS